MKIIFIYLLFPALFLVLVNSKPAKLTGISNSLLRRELRDLASASDTESVVSTAVPTTTEEYLVNPIDPNKFGTKWREEIGKFRIIH